MFPIADENLPGRGLPWVTIGLIAANVAVFLLLQAASADNTFTYAWSAVPFEITTGVDLTQAVPILIDGHAVPGPAGAGPGPDLPHPAVEHVHARQLAAPGRQHALPVDLRRQRRAPRRPDPLPGRLPRHRAGRLDGPDPGRPGSYIPSLGASGAISGVLGAYIVLFPRNRVTAFVFRFFMQVPALVAIGMWIALQLLSRPGRPGRRRRGCVPGAHRRVRGGCRGGAAAADAPRSRTPISVRHDALTADGRAKSPGDSGDPAGYHARAR